MIAASGVGKLGFATFPLATVLLAHGESGSFVNAGLAAGAWSFGGTVTAPIRGHLVDRYRTRIPLAGLTLTAALAVVGLATVSGTTALVCFGALAGASAPPIVASVRPLWKHVLPHDLVRTAYAVDAILTELAKICGPLVAAVAAARSPQLGVVTAGTLLVIGTLLLIARPNAAPRPTTSETRTRAAVLASPALRLLLLSNIATGLCLGALTVGLPARAAEHGSATGSGWLFACLGIGSAVSGVWFGGRHRHTAPVIGYVVGLTWIALALLLAASLPAGVPLAVVLLIAGGAFAPVTVCLFELLDEHAPRGTEVTSMMWMVSGEELGIALGTSLSGAQAQDVGAWLALVTAAASAALGAGFLAAGRHVLARGNGTQMRLDDRDSA
ncbi:MFS transporter [Streptomyces sp. BH104]|uniref:MFS transporter n=1 Tax=Streptomyces sp. BH104 TaxID=3410407 RepID=UPI003BB59297